MARTQHRCSMRDSMTAGRHSNRNATSSTMLPGWTAEVQLRPIFKEIFMWFGMRRSPGIRMAKPAEQYLLRVRVMKEKHLSAKRQPYQNQPARAHAAECEHTLIGLEQFTSCLERRWSTLTATKLF